MSTRATVQRPRISTPQNGGNQEIDFGADARLPRAETMLVAFNPAEPADEPKAPALPRLNKPLGLSSVKLPDFKDIDRQNFDRDIGKILTDLATVSPYFKSVAEAAKTNGYTFVAYDPENKKIPDAIHQMMKTGRYGAFTLANEKLVVINTKALQAEAAAQKVPEGQMLAQTLANEGIHIIANVSHPRVAAADRVVEFEKIARAENYTEREKQFQKLLLEELTSEVALNVVRRQFEDPEFKLPKDGLKEDYFRFNNWKFTMASNLVSRFYEGADPNRQDKSEAESIVLKRVAAFLKSGEVEKEIYARLAKYDMTK